jgi:hypothetical protein
MICMVWSPLKMVTITNKKSSCTRLHYISSRLNDNKHRQNIQRLVANKDDLEKACDCKISMKKKEKNKKKKIQKRRERGRAIQHG